MHLKVSELFASVQGEGPSAGAPCTFLRLAQCNLHCAWCDTKYTWDWTTFRFEDEVRSENISDVARRIRALSNERLVVTGGEPLLQDEGIVELLGLLDAGRRPLVEIETNGTIAPSVGLTERVDQWNVSPKLANSGDLERLRSKPEVLARFRATGRACLKLVVETAADTDEAQALVRSLDWPDDHVFLMAQASNRAALAVREPVISAEALRRGFRYSPRLHIERWDGARGV